MFQVRCSREEDILKYCDKYTPGAVQEYYFDRYQRVVMINTPCSYMFLLHFT